MRTFLSGTWYALRAAGLFAGAAGVAELRMRLLSETGSRQWIEAAGNSLETDVLTEFHRENAVM